MPEFDIRYDGDLYVLDFAGEHVDAFTDTDEALDALHKKLVEWFAPIRSAMVAADSELSAIGHGRPPSSKAELLTISDKLRKYT